MFTPYRIAFRVNTKSYPVYHEQQRHTRGTSHSQTLNIVPEWLTKWLLFSKSQLFTLAQWISVLFPSYSLPLQSRHRLILHHSLAQNPSNVMSSTFQIGAVQLHSIYHRNCAKLSILCEQKPYLE